MVNHGTSRPWRPFSRSYLCLSSLQVDFIGLLYRLLSTTLSSSPKEYFEHPDPRKHFVRDLTSIVTAYYKQDSDIILMGDFNEVIGLKAEAMASVVRAGHLTDTQIFCHGLTTEDSTYARGPNRVDYIFASARLLPFILRQGCEPFNAQIFCDHRAVFLDLSYPGIFVRTTNVLAHPRAAT